MTGGIAAPASHVDAGAFLWATPRGHEAVSCSNETYIEREGLAPACPHSIVDSKTMPPKGGTSNLLWARLLLLSRVPPLGGCRLY
jgi:hypothetical protein